MANKLKKKDITFESLDLKPFMNLMIVLVPLLLLGAEFAKIAIIDIKLPESRGSQTEQAIKQQPKEEEEKLLLTAIITDSVLTLGAKSGFLPSLFYKEYHRYVSKDDQFEFEIPYDPTNRQMPKHPKTGREMTLTERYDILLYETDENFSEIKKGLYTKYGEYVTNTSFGNISSVNPGDTVYILSNPRRLQIVSNPADFIPRNISVYDELKNRLMQIKERYKDTATDADAIIIAAENQIIYDKIVQIMDAARAADFPNISIAKLRG